MRHRQIRPSSSATAKKPAAPEYGNLKTGRQLSSDTTVTLSSEQIYRLHCENDARESSLPNQSCRRRRKVVPAHGPAGISLLQKAFVHTLGHKESAKISRVGHATFIWLYCFRSVVHCNVYRCSGVLCR
jgi:hypothetical protein